jgi:hypothetical protein
MPVADDGFGNYYVQLCDYDGGSVQPVCFVEGTSDESIEYVVASDMLRFALHRKTPFCTRTIHDTVWCQRVLAPNRISAVDSRTCR